jgi:hypothetical protein
MRKKEIKGKVESVSYAHHEELYGKDPFLTGKFRLAFAPS